MLPSTTVPRGVFTLHTDASGTAPPDAFGPFRVLHQIGAGVLGPVFRAYQPDPGRLVAVKQFRIDLPPENAHRFVAALDRLIAADLTHLGIAAPLAAGLTDNAPYLALDFVAAESFDVVIRDYGPAPIADALRIATQLGGALDFAAAVNVFHGALHPRDVLVSADDTRVTGLGIAQALEQVGVVPPVRRPYAAPERVAGTTWDRRADTFSLAALVYEMLFARRIAGVGQDAADAIVPLAGIEAEPVRSLFARALAEDPAQRFETALAFAEALHDVLSSPAPTAKPARRSRKRDTDVGVAVSRLGLPLEPDDERAADGSRDRISTPEPDAPEMGLGLTIEHRELAHDATLAHVADSVPHAADTAHVGDLELKAAEEERYEFADSESAVPEVVADRQPDIPSPPPVPVPAPAVAHDVLIERERLERLTSSHDDMVRATAAEPHFLASSALERSRSAVWPLVLALVVGVAIGFASAYGLFIMRDHANVDRFVQQGSAAGAARPAGAADAGASSRTDGPASEPRTATDSASTTPPQRTTPPPAPPAAAATPPSEPARAKTPAPAERPTADSGRVLVRSTPAGARVLLDGRDVGATPLTLSKVTIGTHVVRITHQGYSPAERRVRIRSTQPAQSIEVDLVATRAARETAAPPAAPERTSGSLMVDSRPSGARVLVDGRMVGTTPLLLDDVAVGDHTVRLELDGFNAWSSPARVVGGERLRVSGSLEQR